MDPKDKCEMLTSHCASILSHLNDLFAKATKEEVNWGKVSTLTHFKSVLTNALSSVSGLEPEEIEETVMELFETA